MDPPDIAIPEGGGKRRKLLSLFPKSEESDRSNVALIKTVVNILGIADGFPALDNLGDVNEQKYLKPDASGSPRIHKAGCYKKLKPIKWVWNLF